VGLAICKISIQDQNKTPVTNDYGIDTTKKAANINSLLYGDLYNHQVLSSPSLSTIESNWNEPDGREMTAAIYSINPPRSQRNWSTFCQIVRIKSGTKSNMAHPSPYPLISLDPLKIKSLRA
jgi:hypothetical protein